MLVNFAFAPKVTTLLNKAVASRWPDSLPWHDRITEKEGNEQTLFFWNICPDSHGTICAEALSVRVTGLRVTLRDHALLDTTYEKITLVHEASQITPRIFTTTLDIGIGSLQLPHEFAKRITELKFKFETSVAQLKAA